MRQPDVAVIKTEIIVEVESRPKPESSCTRRHCFEPPSRHEQRVWSTFLICSVLYAFPRLKKQFSQARISIFLRFSKNDMKKTLGSLNKIHKYESRTGMDWSWISYVYSEQSEIERRSSFLWFLIFIFSEQTIFEQYRWKFVPSFSINRR